jgi:hypothetical protein
MLSQHKSLVCLPWIPPHKPIQDAEEVSMAEESVSARFTRKKRPEAKSLAPATSAPSAPSWFHMTRAGHALEGWYFACFFQQNPSRRCLLRFLAMIASSHRELHNKYSSIFCPEDAETEHMAKNLAIVVIPLVVYL